MDICFIKPLSYIAMVDKGLKLYSYAIAMVDKGLKLYSYAIAVFLCYPKLKTSEVSYLVNFCLHVSFRVLLLVLETIPVHLL